MSTIAGGSLTGFFLYDVAEAIDLDAVTRLIAPTTSTRVAPKPPVPPYVQYRRSPVSIEGPVVDMPDLDGWHLRFKTFDYGVISLALTRPIPTAWEDVLAIGVRWHEDADLPRAAEQCCRSLVERLQPA